MSKKSNNIAKLIEITLIALTIGLSAIFTLSGGFTQKTSLPTELGTQSEDGTPSQFKEYILNVSVIDNKQNGLKNAWVVVFDNNNVARLFGYTNESGTISFELFPGDYQVKFEKYHYISQSADIKVVDKDVNITQEMKFEEVVLFGSIPSWALMVIIGLIAFGLIYWNRNSLRLNRFGRPDNWFGSAKAGSWTFLDKSTKTVLYAISAILLVILIIVIIPNFPTFKDMAIYYVLLGIIAVGGLLLEGSNKKSWIASIGFGKSDEIVGNVTLGIAFALVFIGLTGFISQLSIFDAQMGSIISILMFVMVASFFEEGFFSGILAPTIAEKSGMVASIFITSILFSLAHGFAYGWAIPSLFIAFLFRIFATIFVLQTKSWLGIFIAHAFINALSLFSFMMFS